MTEQPDHERLADELDEQAKELEQRSQRLQDEVEDVRSDWEAKRSDGSVPGAMPPERDSPEPEDPASFPGKTDEQPDD